MTERDLTVSYHGVTDAAHRRRFGQFMTPAPIARFMVQWAVQGGAHCVHDPAFGLGAFEMEARKLGFRCTGHEVDPVIAAHWRSAIAGALHKGVKVCDYLQDWNGRHDAVVCNPPYMRFHHFTGKDLVVSLIRRRTGVPLSGQANSASAFLLKSVSELSPNGRLAYVMPLEFLNACYGQAVKARLLAERHLVAIIRVSCEKEAFPDATTTVGILLYDRSADARSVRFASIDALSELAGEASLPSGIDVPHARLDPFDKWLPMFNDSSIRSAPGMVRISDYGRFKRGIATGAKGFFSLRPSEVKALNLRDGVEARPCVVRSADVTNPVLDVKGMRGLEEADAKVRLFSPQDPPSAEAQRWIKEGEAQGVHLRHLTSSRRPWHRTERRQPASIWLGTFSRNGYKVVLNRANALSLACFHGFTPSGEGAEWVDRLFLYLLSDAGRKLLALSGREYGGGLRKFEPNDLNGACAPSHSWLADISESLAEEAIDAVSRDGVLPQCVNERFNELIVNAPELPIINGQANGSWV